VTIILRKFLVDFFGMLPLILTEVRCLLFGQGDSMARLTKFWNVETRQVKVFLFSLIFSVVAASAALKLFPETSSYSIIVKLGRVAGEVIEEPIYLVERLNSPLFLRSIKVIHDEETSNFLSTEGKVSLRAAILRGSQVGVRIVVNAETQALALTVSDALKQTLSQFYTEKEFKRIEQVSAALDDYKTLMGCSAQGCGVQADVSPTHQRQLNVNPLLMDQTEFFDLGIGNPNRALVKFVIYFMCLSFSALLAYVNLRFSAFKLEKDQERN